ncbi:hypothetical protein ON010_g628 [Phytophthora cinnamomi]|nr:hypothetical protein ON010_g628 [Phytophthora cinnamomi]
MNDVAHERAAEAAALIVFVFPLCVHPDLEAKVGKVIEAPFELVVRVIGDCGILDRRYTGRLVLQEDIYVVVHDAVALRRAVDLDMVDLL